MSGDGFLQKITPGPLTQCCCGCTLGTGVLTILALNFVLNIWLVVAAAGDIIGKDPTFSYSGSDLILETIVAAFALAGIPIIFGGIWGVMSKDKNLILLYWYYAALAFCFSIWWLVVEVMIMSPCDKLPSHLMNPGRAYSCGLSKVLNVFVCIVWFAFPLYFLFIIYSYCAQLTYCLNKSEFSALKASKAKIMMPWLNKGPDPMHHYDGYMTTPIVGAATSHKVFNGTMHDMDYPPRQPPRQP